MENNERQKSDETIKVTLDPSSPSFASIARVVVITLIILGVAGFLGDIASSIGHLALLIVLSIFFAYLLAPLVRLIQLPFRLRASERLMPRWLAISIAYLIVFSVLGFAVGVLAPKIADQGADFSKNFPEYASAAQEKLRGLNETFRRMRPSKWLQEAVTEKTETVISAASERAAAVFGDLALGMVTYSPWLFLIPILAFFFLKDVDAIKQLFLGIFPDGKWRRRTEAILNDANLTLSAYTRAQLISCLLIGVVCTIGFYILGVKYPLLFGILAGVFEFVPLIGPLTIGLTVTLVTGFGDVRGGVYVGIFLVVLRIIHDYVTYPRIIREGIHLHPLAIILSVLAGEQVGGILGVFLSIPVVALLTVLHRHALLHRSSEGLLGEWLDDID